MNLFLISSCTFLILLFSLKLIFTKSNNKLINIIFALALLIRSGMNIVFISIKTDFIDNFPYILKIFTPFYYVMPALLFLYLRNLILNRITFRKYDWLHFLPFIFGIIDILFWITGSNELFYSTINQIDRENFILFEVMTGKISQQSHYLIQPLLFWIYLFIIARLFYKNIKFHDLISLSISMKWSLILYLFCITSQVIVMIQLFQFNSDIPKDAFSYKFPFYFLVIQFLLIIIYIIHNSEILYGFLYINKQNTLNNQNHEISETVVLENIITDNIKTKENVTEIIEPKKIKLSPEIVTKYRNQVDELMKTQKLYLDSNFQISDLSAALNISNHHCSYFLNTFIQKNFRDWTNEYRIKHFISEYEQQRSKKTIEAMAQDAGFKNTTTFYNAFKKVMNCSPSEYFNKE